VAVELMKSRGIAIDDLHAFALPRLAKLQRPKNVHFSPEGSQQLARRVVRSIRRALDH